jgi:hypothetical protein
MSEYTLDDYERDLDDRHQDDLEATREEAHELERYFGEKDPFYYSSIDDLPASWFEPDPAYVDAAFERHLWLTETE